MREINDMFKSDVFSAGLVIFQIASLRDVNGFNQKTDQLSLMLKFNENDRPNFIDLVKYLEKNNDYMPKPNMTLIQYIEQRNKNKSHKYLQNNSNKNSSFNENNNNSSILNNKYSNSNSNQSSSTTNDIPDNQKIKIFNQYKIKNKVNNILTLKNAFGLNTEEI